MAERGGRWATSGPGAGFALALGVTRGLNGSTVTSRAHHSALSQLLAMKSSNTELGRPWETI